VARIVHLLTARGERESIKGCSSVEGSARLVGKAEFTVRGWCRPGRIQAVKKRCERGKFFAGVASPTERLRDRREGLLPPTRR
jgi:hypothetical protein